MTCALPGHAYGLTVFAAASLKDALDEQVRILGSAGVRVSYAASSALARQIERGAPADLFISADADWMDHVQKRDLIARATRVDLLGNRLVLIAPQASAVRLTASPGFALAQALGRERLAIADPDHVPAGRYARAALESLKVWNEVAPRIARAENVRIALALVARGESPLGIVYRTDALAERRVRVVAEIPASSHAAIVYPAAVTAASRNPEAGRLLAFLASPAANAVWEKHGFMPLP